MQEKYDRKEIRMECQSSSCFMGAEPSGFVWKPHMHPKAILSYRSRVNISDMTGHCFDPADVCYTSLSHKTSKVMGWEHKVCAYRFVSRKIIGKSDVELLLKLTD